ncbi:MAG: Ig-like domain-containing protein, partial [Sediminibacterium sp.]|nr:Ig-like domain-containing protein [Sediminibacterium sp.]
MNFLKFFAFSFLLYFILIFNNHCASVATSLGGPKDSLSPILIKSSPKDSQLNFKGKKIQFYFNEFIQGKDLNQRFFMSPNLKNPPLLTTNLNKFIVEILDTLQDSTTYSFVVDKGIADLNEGNIYKKLSFCFSTGNQIDIAQYKGVVINAETGGFDSTLIVVLYKNLLNDSIVFKEQPDYYAPIDNKGRFSFNFLPKDSFLAFVLPNGFNKSYLDSTKPFAFLSHISISTIDTL